MAKFRTFYSSHNLQWDNLFKYLLMMFFPQLFQATLIPATVIVHLLPAFRQRLKVGSLFTLGGLEMARRHQNYRLSDSALMIRFSDSTKFSALAEPVCPIPEEHFKFCENNSLHGLANNNTKLPGTSYHYLFISYLSLKQVNNKADPHLLVR